MSSEDRFGRLSDAEMEKMMSDKDAVNTIILTLFTLFPCYCYKFKMKERHKFTLFLFKHAKIIVIGSFGIIKQLLPSYEVNIQIVYPRRVVFPREDNPRQVNNMNVHLV